MRKIAGLVLALAAQAALAGTSSGKKVLVASMTELDPPAGQLAKVDIYRADVDTGTNVVFVQGQGFGTDGVAVLLGTRQLDVASYSPTDIAATLPDDVKPGTYRLFVVRSQNAQSAYIDVAIGGVGLQGPAGPQGAKGDPGAPGAPGEKGDKGDPGAPGAPGEKGDQGAPGLNGERGAKGDKGDPGANGAQGPKGMHWRGEWVASEFYQVDDAVQLGGSSYIAVAPNSVRMPPSAEWSLLASAGAPGTSGRDGMNGTDGAAGPMGPEGPPGLSWRGAWDGTATYEKGDVVSYANASYVAPASIRPTDPPTPPPNGGWNVMAAAGAPAPTGWSVDRPTSVTLTVTTGSGTVALDALCASPKVALSGGCSPVDGQSGSVGSYPYFDGTKQLWGWRCEFKQRTTGSYSVRVYAMCASVR